MRCAEALRDRSDEELTFLYSPTLQGRVPPIQHPLNMRAMQYYGPRDMRLEDIPEPQVRDNQVKIKVCNRREN